jgi:hypothetical protein
MNNNEKVYRKLQKHLDSQAVGFPATKSAERKKGSKASHAKKQVD